MMTYILGDEDDPYRGEYEDHSSVEEQWKQLMDAPKVNNIDTDEMRK